MHPAAEYLVEQKFEFRTNQHESAIKGRFDVGYTTVAFNVFEDRRQAKYRFMCCTQN